MLRGEFVEPSPLFPTVKTAKELGSPVALKGFVRFALGEGVEKPPAEDFAAEVAAAMAGQA